MIKLNDILNEDYPFDVYKKIEKLKGGALLRFGNEIWIKIGNRKDQWLCGKGIEKGVISDSTVVAQRIAKSNKKLKIESKLTEAKMTQTHAKILSNLFIRTSVESVIPHKDILFVNYTKYSERRKLIKYAEKLFKYDSDGRMTNAPSGIPGVGGTNWIAFKSRN